MWQDRRILDLFGIDHPLLLAPMAGSAGSALAVAVAKAGGLPALPCALLSPEQMRAEIGVIRQQATGPLNLNFFCHTPPEPDPAREQAWRAKIAALYGPVPDGPDAPPRRPFDEAACAVVEDSRPEVVSFHFGLPAAPLLARVRATGARIIASATTVDEAVWLERSGVDAVIAQGAEAGGHRGMFLGLDTATQTGTFSLVPLVTDAVKVPVIAAGGVSDGRAMAAALVLGAAAVQVGTAFLRSPEALTSTLHRKALAAGGPTAMTNVITGRPARGFTTRLVRDVGPINPDAPAFPLASNAIASLRKAAEADGRPDFSPVWAGQSFSLASEEPATVIAERIVRDAARLLDR
ncbi:nitronate monooxygenase family protein [Emcibacter sp. SYSU 3D8]|uniref:NAD(P)H-dependent flavin oxidoreductase n=1 Tax=Emcibacter sp. SYSU 3D8 TaxID=3133969 RepID=UPI0031FF007A